MGYEKRILIFIDILGFKEHINRTTGANGEKHIESINSLFDEIETYYNLCKQASDEGEILPKSLTITTFSDSAVISFNSEEFSKFFDVVYSVAKYINVKAVEKGFLLRGAIVEGDIFHTSARIFGPALVDAHKLETTIALYPRIIISKEILNKQLRGDTNDNRAINNFPHNKALQEDTDELGYVDYLSNVNGILENDRKRIIEYYKKLRIIIDSGLANEREDIRIKHSWLDEKYKLAKEVIQLTKESEL